MNFIEKIKNRDEKRLKELADNYYIPKRFKDAKMVFGSKNKDIVKEYNKIYSEMQYQVPKETGEYIEKLFDNDNYLLGIHRSASNYQDVFKNGIKMRSNDFTDNIQISGYLPFLLEQIKYCEDYKCSTGCFIIQILKNNDKPIYFANEDGYYLLPEYIAGYVHVFQQKCDSIIKNPNYKEIHDYQFDGLEYDERLENPNFNMRKCK